MNTHIRSVVPTLFVLALLTVAGDLAAQSTRIGYINSQRVMLEAPRAAAAQDSLARVMRAMEMEVDSLQVDLERRRVQLEQQSATLSAAARQQRQQDLGRRFGEFQQRVDSMEVAAQQVRSELLRPIMDDIRTVIEEIRREGNYAMIFDQATGAMVAVDPRLDLTDQVLTRLRRMTAAPGR